MPRVPPSLRSSGSELTPNPDSPVPLTFQCADPWVRPARVTSPVTLELTILPCTSSGTVGRYWVAPALAGSPVRFLGAAGPPRDVGPPLPGRRFLPGGTGGLRGLCRLGGSGLLGGGLAGRLVAGLASPATEPVPGRAPGRRRIRHRRRQSQDPVHPVIATGPQRGHRLGFVARGIGDQADQQKCCGRCCS